MEKEKEDRLKEAGFLIFHNPEDLFNHIFGPVEEDIPLDGGDSTGNPGLIDDEN